MTQGIQKQIGILPAVEAECHLIQVGGEGLCADPVPRPDDAALQERECVFHRVRVNVALNVDFSLVPDSLMLHGWDSGFGHRVRVGWMFVRHDYVHIGANVLPDVLSYRPSPDIACMKKTRFAAALTDADYDLLC